MQMTLLKRLIPGFLIFFASPLLSEEPIIYPAQGQSSEQQKQDEGECHIWVKDNTGVDPAALAAETAQQQSELAQQQSELAQQASQPAPAPERRRGGAIKGAAAGAVVGEIVDDDHESLSTRRFADLL
jgi:ferric-dicitrate binding protein FerR (iron transport regulator)